MDLIEDSIEDYKNKHQGERVFIIGNGPSLKDTPLDLIENEYSMAMNQIDLLYSDMEWRPTYYFQMNSISSSNKNVESTKKHLDKGLPCFINSEFKHKFGDRKNSYYLNVEGTDLLPTYYNNIENLSSYWSTDVQQVVYKYSTSLYCVVQVAQYMGFDTIYFLGCDLYPVLLIDELLPEKLINRGAHPYESDYGSYNSSLNALKYYIFEFSIKHDYPISTVVNGIWSKFKNTLVSISKVIDKKYGDVKNSHFTSEYRNKFYRSFKNDKLVDAHKLINVASKKYGFKCYNASVGGKLEVHECVDFIGIARS